GAAELDGAERLTAPSAPATVIPGANDEKVLVLGVVLLERAVDRDGTVEVLLIPPAGHVERGHGDAIEILHQRLALPEGVKVRVADEVVPGGTRALEILLIHMGKRSL